MTIRTGCLVIAVLTLIGSVALAQGTPKAAKPAPATPQLLGVLAPLTRPVRDAQS